MLLGLRSAAEVPAQACVEGEWDELLALRSFLCAQLPLRYEET